MHPTGSRNAKQGQSLRAKAVVILTWLCGYRCHDKCMARNFGADLKFLRRLAFRRAERSGPLLERFQANEKRIETNPNAKIIWQVYAWLCVPLSLWPIDFDGLSRHLLDCVESEKPLDADIILLLELVGHPPDEKTISVVAEFEHVVESGNYDRLVKRPEKFTEIETSLKRDPALAKAWADIKARWNTKEHENSRGVIRRRLSQERNLRGDWQFDWNDETKKFFSAFDAMCYRWKLYGMERDNPLVLKISVNPTPHGTMILIPRDFSLDPDRDLDWKEIAKLHRSQGAQRQGPKMSPARLQKQEDAMKVLKCWDEAGKRGFRGSRRYDYVHEQLKRDGRTDQSWVLRHLRIARQQKA